MAGLATEAAAVAAPARPAALRNSRRFMLSSGTVWTGIDPRAVSLFITKPRRVGTRKCAQLHSSNPPAQRRAARDTKKGRRDAGPRWISLRHLRRCLTGAPPRQARVRERIM